jgi:hypothetical protein
MTTRCDILPLRPAQRSLTETIYLMIVICRLLAISPEKAVGLILASVPGPWTGQLERPCLGGAKPIQS